MKILLAFAACAAVSFGCSQVLPNVRLQRTLTQAEVARDRTLPRDPSNELAVILSFSGGGVRAAALAYGVLEGLASTRIPDRDGTHRLLDDVTLITSVSGGSFPAAYYGLYGDRIFTDFERKFLKGRVGRAILLRLAAPWNWLRLLMTPFGRSDLAAELYDDLLFDGATFAEINDHAGPTIAIQATDVVEGGRFAFSNYWFSAICSDLARFPVARAVAASAAFPVVFSPVVLQNHAGSCEYTEPPWVSEALALGPDAGRIYQNARHVRAYRDATAIPRIYLVDGGVADNLGLHRVLDAVTNRRSITATLRDRGLENVKRIAFIIVNAQTQPGKGWGIANATPGLATLIDAVASAQVNRYNFETIELLRRSIDDWSSHVHSYVVDVSFEQLPDERERRSFMGIPTAFDVPESEIDRLREVGRRLLFDSADFRLLLHDLGADQRVSAIERDSSD